MMSEFITKWRYVIYIVILLCVVAFAMFGR